MALADFTPTVAEVAAHIRARTKDSFQEVGTFNDDTRPTADQVEELLARGARDVASHIGVEICEGDSTDRQAELYEEAKDLAALAVALKIELSYYPEQVASNRSPYTQLKELYDEGKKTLIEAVSEHCGGGDGESVGGDLDAGLPSYGFPDPVLNRGMGW